MSDLIKDFNKMFDELDECSARMRKRAEELYPIADKLTTPTGIKFALSDDGTVTGLLFNENKQRLHYCGLVEVYEVISISLEYTTFEVKECLPLTPCKYEDLKAGDFSFRSIKGKPDFQSFTHYGMKLPQDTDNLWRVKILDDRSATRYALANTTGMNCWKVGK